MAAGLNLQRSMAIPSFEEFFSAVWGYTPFPWQAMLADRVTAGAWPKALDLPTASGKTACIDIAIYALASQADRTLQERSAPRRIWFVVDRRIVIDEAFERAKTIVCALERPKEYLLKRLHAQKAKNCLTEDEISTVSARLQIIADRLLMLSGTARPLAAARLRGGIVSDDRWSRLPSQPAVITSTVDQLGSRLLFRSYGASSLVSPIHAGLTCNDSLILLDEAHCSVPFMQTLRSVDFYRGKSWCEQNLSTPFAFSIMSATPPSDIPLESVFPGAQRDIALASTILSDRLNGIKSAELRCLKSARGATLDPLIEEATTLATCWVREHRKIRVAVIVNRVQVAAQLADQLRISFKQDEADVVLLTGRFRPLERDMVVEQWKAFLKASNPEVPSRPIILISTQCIEVGADFSFDALLTECASLDALRQRFGRLNRMGLPDQTLSAILVREEALRDDAHDPIYGCSLRETWNLLNEKAAEEKVDKQHVRRIIDFGFAALEKTFSDVDDERLSACIAPRPDAPVLLPAHLDLLCQTAPYPCPEPDITIFLHGKERGAPEAQILWRSDLHRSNTDSWVETVAMCPPLSLESVAVPLHRLRKWLADSTAPERAGDVEGEPELKDGEDRQQTRPFLLWRGRDRSKVSYTANAIVPGTVVVVPSDYGISGLAHTVTDSEQKRGWGETKVDLWEWALDVAQKPKALRIQRDLWAPWLTCAAVRELVLYAETPDWQRERLWELVDNVINLEPSDEGTFATPPAWIIDYLKSLPRNSRIETHPAGGLVFFERYRKDMGKEPDLFEDDDDLTSLSGNAVPLDMHTALVARTAKNFSARCLPAEFITTFELAGQWHDAGKLDERFQLLLHQGDEFAISVGEPLAKSPDLALSPARRRAIRDASGLPEDFRHEMLSTQLAERFAPLPSEAHWSALVLHLIASHHGHARPFAPVSLDSEPPAIQGRLAGVNINLAAADRVNFAPSYKIDSEIAKRFWDSTRRYGWWGLAYLEAVLRLSDWYGSSFEFAKNESEEEDR